jgi:hypothetical protein
MQMRIRLLPLVLQLHSHQPRRSPEIRFWDSMRCDTLNPKIAWKTENMHTKNNFKLHGTLYISALIVTPLLLCEFPKVLYAQQIITTLNKDDSRHFKTALNQVAKLGKITIIAEGYPLKETLSDAEIPTFSPTGEQVKTSLEKISLAYDYTVRQYGTVYVLQKRFTDPKDLPNVTLQEIGTCLSNIRKSTSALNPGFSGPALFDPLSTEFIPSLTADQLSLMSGADGGLPVSSLPQQQQQTLRRVAYHNFIQRYLIDFEDIEVILNRISRSGTLFKRQTVSEITYFGYEFPVQVRTPSVTNAPKREFIIMNNSLGEVSRYNMTVKSHGGSAWLGLSTKSDPDKSSDHHGNSQSNAINNDSKSDTPETITLQNLCTLLNQKETGSTNRRRFDIDPELATLPVTVVNLTSTDSKTIWEAVASIYGLKIYNTVPNAKTVGSDITTFRISHPRAFVARVPEDLRNTLINAIPQSFLRACSQDMPNNSANRTNGTVSSQQTSAQSLDREKIISLRSAALKQLRTLVEPRLVGSTATGLTLDDLGESGRQALAVYLLTGVLDPESGVSSLLNIETPDYIQKFDEAFLKRNLYEKDGKKFYSITFDVVDPRMKNGKRPAFGVFGLEVKNNQ